MRRVARPRRRMGWRPVAAAACLGAFAASAAAQDDGDTAYVRIVSTNDIHSYLRPIHYRYLDESRPWGRQSTEGNYTAKARWEGKVGGMAHVATLIKRLRAERPGATLVVDAGDTWHGAGVSVLDRGVSMVKIMNAIGYDLMALGNWEFFHPKEHLLDLVEQAEFPVVAFNVTDEEWNEPVFEPWVLREVGGLRVALVGMTYPWTALTSAATKAAAGWNFGIKEEAAREIIEEIRETEAPDLIVVVSHGGYGLDQKFARRVDGIDVLVSGHTHDEVFDPVVWNDTIVYQGGALGEYVARLDVGVRDGAVADYSYRLIKVRQAEVPPDPEIAALVEDAYRPHEARLGEVIGRSDVMLFRRDYFQSTMGNLLTDTLRELAGTDVAFFPAWRYGATLLPGPITVEDVYNVVPTDGRIVTWRMSGKALRRLLENVLASVVDGDPYSRVGGDMIRFSGMKLVYDLSRPADERVVSLEVAGKSASEEAMYTVASVHTRFQENPLFGALGIEDTGRVFVEELIGHIRERSRIATVLDDRIASVREAAAAAR